MIQVVRGLRIGWPLCMVLAACLAAGGCGVSPEKTLQMTLSEEPLVMIGVSPERMDQIARENELPNWRTWRAAAGTSYRYVDEPKVLESLGVTEWQWVFFRVGTVPHVDHPGKRTYFFYDEKSQRLVIVADP